MLKIQDEPRKYRFKRIHQFVAVTLSWYARFI